MARTRSASSLAPGPKANGNDENDPVLGRLLAANTWINPATQLAYELKKREQACQLPLADIFRREHEIRKAYAAGETEAKAIEEMLTALLKVSSSRGQKIPSGF